MNKGIWTLLVISGKHIALDFALGNSLFISGVLLLLIVVGYIVKLKR